MHLTGEDATCIPVYSGLQERVLFYLCSLIKYYSVYNMSQHILYTILSEV